MKPNTAHSQVAIFSGFKCQCMLFPLFNTAAFNQKPTGECQFCVNRCQYNDSVECFKLRVLSTQFVEKSV